MSRRVALTEQKGGARSDYQTPRWVIDRFLEAEPNFLFDSSRILEPNAGEGRIIDALEDAGYQGDMWAFEIAGKYEAWLRETAANHVMIGDCFELIDQYPGGGVLITNPAFPISERMLQCYWSVVDHIVFFQQMGFLCSAKRHEFMASRMPDCYLLPNRPSFTPDGKTDQAHYAWLHWDTSKPKSQGTIQLLGNTVGRGAKNRR